MATVLLVHGAWLGGWCWKYVTHPLRSVDHDVYTLTLTGLGEREHLSRPDIDLETHITDVVNVLEYEDLTDVVLVGHSYAGLVVTGVIDRVPERVTHVVYLDAMTPLNDEATSVFDLGPPEYREVVEAEAEEQGAGWRWPMPREPDGWVGISESDARWLRSKAVPQPVETFAQSVEVRNQAASVLPSTYVLCTKNGLPDETLETIRGVVDERGWDLVELETGHWPMVSMPSEVVELLDTAASTTQGAST
ncbi:alpha/beta hydrolase [Halomicroarcula sp. S1AR25-4]|uniref:alpha/beta fold hydrolase n=1 Tax=Haloarcula sp. S1AR25-4 TaxID=2950538 RepID=UPI0028746323|nr:alpha/beta hydrolase [Halomicroarcula sp. S1AR25-4]MDS0279527.1 alpha/beta hydrolase [Halomicroarcula sp. S1AR25-4]